MRKTKTSPTNVGEVCELSALGGLALLPFLCGLALLCRLSLFCGHVFLKKKFVRTESRKSCCQLFFFG